MSEAILIERGSFFTTGGVPAVGGKLYIGQQGLAPKTNPKSIYTDRALTIAAANPQTLDSYGKATNKIWVEGAHSVEVYDSNDVLLYQDLDAGGTSGTGSQKLINVAGSDTITAQGDPTVTALVNQQLYSFVAAANNTGAAATLQIDSLPATAIKDKDGLNLTQDAITANTVIFVTYNSAQSRFELVSGADLTTAVKENELALVALQYGNFEVDSVTVNAPLNAVSKGGQYWVAVGDYYAPGLNSEFFTSADDGETWSVMASGNPNKTGDLNFVGGMGNRLITGGGSDGTDAKLLWANDFIGPWTEIANPKNIELRASASGLANGVVVGDADGGDAYILYSADPSLGVTEAVNPKNVNLNYVENVGSAYLAGGDWDGADPYMIRSTDGITWVEVDLTSFGFTTGDDVTGIVTGNGYTLVSFSDGSLLQTFDEGLTFVDITAQLPVVSASTYRLFFHGGENAFFMGFNAGDFYVTPDGITWRKINEPGNLINHNDIVWADGRLVGASSQGGGAIVKSTLFL